VELLKAGSDDSLIEQSKARFVLLSTEGNYDGFEVWDQARRVYIHPAVVKPDSTDPKSG
jgi:hypothetical protein